MTKITQASAEYLDAISGQPLIPELVREARRKEMEYFNAKGVWTLRPRDEADYRQVGGRK